MATVVPTPQVPVTEAEHAAVFVQTQLQFVQDKASYVQQWLETNVLKLKIYEHRIAAFWEHFLENWPREVSHGACNTCNHYFRSTLRQLTVFLEPGRNLCTAFTTPEADRIAYQCREEAAGKTAKAPVTR